MPEGLADCETLDPFMEALDAKCKQRRAAIDTINTILGKDK